MEIWEGNIPLWNARCKSLKHSSKKEISIRPVITSDPKEMERHISLESLLPQTIEAFELNVYPLDTNLMISEPFGLSVSSSTQYMQLRQLTLSCAASPKKQKDISKKNNLNLNELANSCPNLEELYVGWPLQEISPPVNRSFSQLTSVIFAWTMIDSLDLRFLKQTKVKDFQLIGNDTLDEINLTPLLYCKQLRKCDLDRQIGTLLLQELNLFDIQELRNRLIPLWEYLTMDTQNGVANFLRTQTSSEEQIKIMQEMMERIQELKDAIVPKIDELLSLSREDRKLLDDIRTNIPDAASMMQQIELLLEKPDALTLDSLDRIEKNVDRLISKIDEKNPEKSKAEKLGGGIKTYIKEISKKPAIDHGAKVVVNLAKMGFQLLQVVGPSILQAMAGSG